MNILTGFQELAVDKEHSQIKIPIRNVELTLGISYFINDSGTGFCALLIKRVTGKGIRGKIEAAAAGVYIGRNIFTFLSELETGKKLITVPALFEKEPSFNRKLDLSDLVINTYYHDNFTKTAQDAYEEHRKALIGKKISNDREKLISSVLELPKKGLEILKAYR